MSEAKTRDEARRRAVEAAECAMCRVCETDSATSTREYAEAMTTAYERAMADAGWRMVRVVEKKAAATTLYISNEALAQEQDLSYVRRHMVEDVTWARGKVEGWNACRAAMLGEGE